MHIQGDLVVAAPCRMQAGTGSADLIRQGGLHVHVDVFQFRLECKGAPFHFRKDFLQAVNDLLAIFLGNNMLMGQHMRMGNAAPDIFLVQPFIVVDGCVEGIHQRVRILTESSAP